MSLSQAAGEAAARRGTVATATGALQRWYFGEDTRAVAPALAPAVAPTLGGAAAGGAAARCYLPLPEDFAAEEAGVVLMCGEGDFSFARCLVALHQDQSQQHHNARSVRRPHVCSAHIAASCYSG